MQHHAEIEVESTPGVGTTFTFRLEALEDGVEKLLTPEARAEKVV
jgi:signal transduction histidine kinase